MRKARDRVNRPSFYGLEQAASIGVTEITIPLTRLHNELPHSCFIWFDIPGPGVLNVPRPVDNTSRNAMTDHDIHSVSQIDMTIMSNTTLFIDHRPVQSQ